MHRNIFLLLITFSLTSSAVAQEHTLELTLEETIEQARQQSPDAQNARHSFRSAYWNYKYYCANYLPTLKLTSNPYLDRAINKVTQSDGNVKFIEQNLLSTDLTLSLTQNVPWTGGTFFIETAAQRLDLFSSDTYSWQTSPVNIGYSQSLFGYNSLKWDRRIEPIRYREAKKTYVETLELVAANATEKFFNLAKAQSNYEIANANYANADTLYIYAQGRYNIGTISENEMLQLELNKLTEETNCMNARIEVENCMQELRSYLGIQEDLLIKVRIDNRVPDLHIDLDAALMLANENSPEIQNMLRRKVESESAVSRAKANAGLKADIYLRFGLTQTADKLKDAYRNPLDQQYVSLGITLPILDWGRGRGQVRVARSNRDLVYTQVEQDKTDFDLNVRKLVKQFNLQAQRVNIAARTDHTAQRRADEVQRPLATVVIGGLILSTILTLIILPVFYKIVNATSAGWKQPKRRLHLFILLPALLLSATVTAQAPQTVSLEQAIKIARQNHPRLKTATTAIRQAQATRGEIVEASPTTFSYSWGQLNGENKKDKEMVLEQNLGSLLTPFYKNTLVNRQVQTGTYYRQMVEKEVTAEVKRAWAYYQYASAICSLYRDQDRMAAELKRISELRYEQGEITLLEKNMMATSAADLHNRLFQAQEEEKMALTRFQWSCYADAPIIPENTSMQLFPTNIQPGSVSEAHLGFFNSQISETRAALNVERSRFFPELSIGYSRQNILPLKNLNAWMVGVSFPIYFLPQKSRIRQAKLAASAAQIQAEANIRELNNKVTELSATLRRHEESLRFYTSSALKEADELIKVANLQLRHSETSIAEFIQSVSAAREIRKGYIETVYQYNIASLEYELYQ